MIAVRGHNPGQKVEALGYPFADEFKEIPSRLFLGAQKGRVNYQFAYAIPLSSRQKAAVLSETKIRCL